MTPYDQGRMIGELTVMGIALFAGFGLGKRGVLYLIRRFKNETKDN